MIINNDITRTCIYTIWIHLYSESNSKVVFILKYTHSLNIIWVHVEVNTLFSLGCASCLYLIPLKGSKEALNTFDLPTRSHAHCIKRSKSSFQRMQSYLYQSLFKIYFSIIRLISLRIYSETLIDISKMLGEIFYNKKVCRQKIQTMYEKVIFGEKVWGHETRLD